MPKSSKHGVLDAENPEMKPGAIAKGMRFNQLPPEMQDILAPKRGRGPQKAPKKQPVSIRLSPDVLKALRAKGRGWQTIADEALRERFVERI